MTVVFIAGGITIKPKMKNQNGIVTELALLVIIIVAVLWFAITRVHNAQG